MVERSPYVIILARDGADGWEVFSTQRGQVVASRGDEAPRAVRSGAFDGIAGRVAFKAVTADEHGVDVPT